MTMCWSKFVNLYLHIAFSRYHLSLAIRISDSAFNHSLYERNYFLGKLMVVATLGQSRSREELLLNSN